MRKEVLRVFSIGSSVVAASTLGLLFLSACGKKEDVPPASKLSAVRSTDVVCSYSPSQSVVVSRLTAAAGSSAIAATTIAQAAGLTAVLHSSGAYIFTGSAGYVAGTIGGAAALPAIVSAGVVVAGSAVTLELVCASRNHPELAAKVELAAGELMERSRRTIAVASKEAAATAGPLIAQAKNVVAKVSADAFEQASRASVEWPQAIRAGWK